MLRTLVLYTVAVLLYCTLLLYYCTEHCCCTHVLYTVVVLLYCTLYNGDYRDNLAILTIINNGMAAADSAVVLLELDVQWD